MISWLYQKVEQIGFKNSFLKIFRFMLCGYFFFHFNPRIQRTIIFAWVGRWSLTRARIGRIFIINLDAGWISSPSEDVCRSHLQNLHRYSFITKSILKNFRFRSLNVLRFPTSPILSPLFFLFLFVFFYSRICILRKRREKR